jgi:5'-3' exonuclease
VDGVVTEDSDALLFGAATVYKNIFSDKKYVEVSSHRTDISSALLPRLPAALAALVLLQVYLAEDARREMGLSREDLVALAYFLGSDYTEGVTGVGIVNAIEIIHAFPMHATDTAAASSSSSSISGTPAWAATDVAEGPLRGLRRFKEWLQGYDFEGEFFAAAGQQGARAEDIAGHTTTVVRSAHYTNTVVIQE